MTVPGEPARLAVPVGGFCVGHAVIVGIDAQARQGGELWYAALDVVQCDPARSNLSSASLPSASTPAAAGNLRAPSAL